MCDEYCNHIVATIAGYAVRESDYTAALAEWEVALKLFNSSRVPIALPNPGECKARLFCPECGSLIRRKRLLALPKKEFKGVPTIYAQYADQLKEFVCAE